MMILIVCIILARASIEQWHEREEYILKYSPLGTLNFHWSMKRRSYEKNCLSMYLYVCVRIESQDLSKTLKLEGTSFGGLLKTQCWWEMNRALPNYHSMLVGLLEVVNQRSAVSGNQNLYRISYNVTALFLMLNGASINSFIADCRSMRTVIFNTDRWINKKYHDSPYASC